MEQTDPAVAREVKFGKRKFTAICAQSQLKRATEIFGPLGSCWAITDERFSVLTEPPCMLYTANLSYSLNLPQLQASGTIPLHSSMSYRDGKVDEDFAKKLATDALTKGLSKLGFNADVFEGKFDDNKYVTEMKTKFAGEGEQCALPPIPADSKPHMKQAYDWCKENHPAFADIEPMKFANLVFLTLGKWPENGEDVKNIMTNMQPDAD